MKSSKKKNSKVLVLEPDDQLASSIREALEKAAPKAVVEMARTLEEAQKLVLGVKPDLFVLDVDAASDLGQDFLFDLRTSHPNARAIILTGTHLPAQREQATGLGAIHFLEKPFPHSDFVDLVGNLLRPAADTDSEKFQGTLSDLHVADIIQLKCMSGANSVVEFTGPRGEKGRVYFQNGQVRHATAPGREGLAAFNEIVAWKGGTISEMGGVDGGPRTIDRDWQVLLMDATRKMDERGAAGDRARSGKRGSSRKVLVTDDSLMLLSFVQEVLIDATFDVTTAATGEECLQLAQKDLPDLILLDYVLPDMKGDEVCRKLSENPTTAGVRVVYMSGIVADLRPELMANPNVIGFLNKPFTSDLLIQTVENHMPKPSEEPEPTEPQIPSTEQESPAAAEFPIEQEAAYRETTEVGPEPAEPTEVPWWTPAPSMSETAPAATQSFGATDFFAPEVPATSVEEQNLPDESVTNGIYFCGDTRFFSLHRALETIAQERVSGTLRSFWNKEAVDILFRNGEILLATTRDPDLYCPEAPVTLTNVDADKIASAREEQRQSGCPLFITLANENLILQEPATQLVQHHGQKLFAQLWGISRVRFSFQKRELPGFVANVPAEANVDQWALATLRLIQFHELGRRADYEPSSIPAYTRDGYERVQNLRLTVGEAQFASQFNGVRSVQQIAKNLRLDLNSARATLFRFVALDIVECWPASTAAGPESKGVFQKLARSIGIGE
jgi:DNA-binding response OmpR family regulator